MVIVGLKRVDFQDKDGDKIQGMKVFVNYPEDKVEGMATDSFFLSDSKFANYFDALYVGSPIEVHYNKYGKIFSVTLG